MCLLSGWGALQYVRLPQNDWLSTYAHFISRNGRFHRYSTQMPLSRAYFPCSTIRTKDDLTSLADYSTSTPYSHSTKLKSGHAFQPFEIKWGRGPGSLGVLPLYYIRLRTKSAFVVVSKGHGLSWMKGLPCFLIQNHMKCGKNWEMKWPTCFVHISFVSSFFNNIQKAP